MAHLFKGCEEVKVLRDRYMEQNVICRIEREDGLWTISNIVKKEWKKESKFAKLCTIIKAKWTKKELDMDI